MSDKEKIVNHRIDIWFTKVGRKIIKYRWVMITLVVLATILAGMGLEKIKYDTSIENWFAKDSKIFANKKQFEACFGNSDVVAIHLKADNVFEAENVNILYELGNELLRKVPFADDVISIADMEYSRTEEDEIITEDLLSSNPDEAELQLAKEKVFKKEYLKNKVVSEDCTETWLVLKLLSYPNDYEEVDGLTPKNQVGKKVLEVLNQDKYKKFNLRHVGIPVYGYEELLFTGAESEKLLGITFIVLIIFLIIFYRSFQGVCIPIVSALASIIIVYGIMGHLGIKMNAFLVSIPVILSLAVSLGYSIHLINYYERSLPLVNSAKEAVALAIGKAGWPTAFAAFTTIGALMSFMAINLIPIRWLGLTSAALILVVYFVVFVLTGSLLSFSKLKNKNVGKPSRGDKYFKGLGEYVFRKSKPIVISTIILAVLMIYGLSSLEVNFDTERSYGMKVPYIKRTLDVAKTRIGSFDSYNISISFDEENKVKEPNILKNFDKYVEYVETLPLTKKTNSILTIVKDMNRLMNNNDNSYYKIPNNKNLIAQLLMFYEMSGGSRMDEWLSDDFSVLRLEVETNNLNANQTMKEMKLLQAKAGEFFPGSEFTITGGMPKFAALNQLVAIGQIKSLILAFIIISILMMFVFGGVKIGLIGLVPNVFPIIIVGGTMSYFGIPLDFLTVTIAPMILGVAVDDTIHLIHHLKNDYAMTGDYQKTSISTIIELGKALFLTSFIIIVSFVVYLTSPINMMIYLGMFVVLGIFTAFVTNLFITPLLIKSIKPFG